jgi:GT2 family glycosyltransferase
MSETKAGLAVCIPTYRRAGLLTRLLGDLRGQTLHPEQLIVVDGDPASGETRAVVESLGMSISPTTYVPANHANLPFQRYLGWRGSAGQRWIVYLDDDLRVLQEDALEKLILPLETLPGEIAGVTARIDFPNRAATHSGVGGSSRVVNASRALAQRFGSAQKTKPGGLTAVGYRKPPADTDEPYAPTEWLRGGVMAFDRNALNEQCFEESLFALAEMRAGLGEDTILSTKAAFRGRLLLARDVRFIHPDDDSPRAYAFQGFRAGWARAYSRRLINDSCRGFAPSSWTDRGALVKHYLGENFVNFRRFQLLRGWTEWKFALGYAWGTWRGVFQPPDAARLTPGVDWRADAADCLRRAVLLLQDPAWR